MYIHVNIVKYTHACTHTVAEQAVVELSAVLMEVAVIIKDTSRYAVIIIYLLTRLLLS